MVKDTSSRTATCQWCGREVNYRTRADKKYSGYYGGGYDSSDDEGYSSGGVGCVSGCVGCLFSCLKVVGIILLAIVAIPLFLILLFMLITGGDFWGFIGSIFGFIWETIVFVFSAIGQFFVWLFHLIF